MSVGAAKQARRQCRESLAEIEAAIGAMARRWDGLTAAPMVADALDELSAAVAQARGTMDEAVAYAVEAEAEAALRWRAEEDN